MTKITKIFYLLLLWVFLIPQAQAEWVDISPNVQVSQTPQALDRVKRVLFSYVTVTNTSSEALVDPVRLVITNPSIPVLNGAGTTDNGDSYLEVAGGLAVGAKTTVRVDFQLARLKLVFGIQVEREKINPSVSLSEATVVYGSSPKLNEELTITIENILETKLIWSVVSEPEGSGVLLNLLDDGRLVKLMPNFVGKYILKFVNSAGEEKTDTFIVSEALKFDEMQISTYDGVADIDDLQGVINNQYWVYSNSLTEQEILNIIANYSHFNPVGCDEVNGVLVEINIDDNGVQEAIKSLELESGIVSVDQRVYSGVNVEKNFGISLKSPDDGSDFDDLGDNWHLENIGILDAWKITTGNKDVLIGIMDSGFYRKHDDLKGRYEKVFSSKKAEHGTGVSGTIAAISDNKIGMSGINWESKLVVNTYLSDCTNDISTDYVNVLKHNKDVKLVSSSWGCGGNNSSGQAAGIVTTRTYRKVAEDYSNKLHIWAAGNDGTNADKQNGAIHLTKNGNYSEMKNVIVVAALLKNGELASYSNYGVTVDIAAPTEFKSTKSYLLDFDDYYEAKSDGLYGTNYSGGFNGTSAAAPVVAGVASLVYSLMPELSPSDVKSILVNSSDSEVITKSGEGSLQKLDFTSKVGGGHPAIPVLNAKAALELTKDIKEGRIAKVSHSFPDAFKAEAKIKVSSANNKLETTEFDYILSINTENIGEVSVYDGIASGIVNGNSVTVSLDPQGISYNVRGGGSNGVKFKHGQTGIILTTNYNYDFDVANIIATVKNTISLQSIPNAEIKIEHVFFTFADVFVYGEGNVDENGQAKLYLIPGAYKITALADGYKEFKKSVFIDGASKSIAIEIAMTPNDIDQVGNIGGIVYDEAGHPLNGALVRLSGGEQTNGFVASTVTDESGRYHLSNISKTDVDVELITSFTLFVSAQGYAETIKENVVVLSNNSVSYNFNLVKQDLTNAIIYSTSFEPNEDNWISTGLWHKENLSASLIYNTLVDNGYSSLPPDEEADHAYLPEADAGDHAIWYGLANTGSFIQTQSSFDDLLSGGTSEFAHSGTIVSPLIDLGSSTNPILKFKTWWEIEGVDPNQNGFDIMDVRVAIGNGEFYSLKRLNPYVDPNDSDRAHKGFSSGGFNRKPVWVLEQIDLSAYAGQKIRIEFSFDTRDGLFNGFRGWLIDSLSIIDGRLIH